MYRFIFLILGLVTLANAQTPEVMITEISSQTVGQMSEWFEFSLWSEHAVEISNWKVSNGTTIKTFWEKRDLLQLENLFDRETFSSESYSGTGFSGSGNSLFEFADALVFLPPESGRAWFFWEKSPVSLRNDGGEISILNENEEILDQTTFPKLKTGTYQGAKYAEIWNRNDDGEGFPLVFRDNGDLNFQHSQGQENFFPPTFPSDIELLINEVSPDRDLPNAKIDFIELFVAHAKDGKANLKYCEIKHNGTPLFFFQTDFWVEEGDFIIVNFDGLSPSISKNSNPFIISTNGKDGLSSGSGTVEIILFSGTSWEITEDFLCWKDGELSSSEKSRVDKNQGVNWNGECVDISDLVPNESIARADIPTDSNTKSDFQRHYNGSPGKNNAGENSPPTAIITIQGARKIYKTTLNFTGEDSTDPDGFSDLQSFEWIKNGMVFSNEINPKSISFSELGTYEISLTVTDRSGAKHTALETIEVVANVYGEQMIDVFHLVSGSGTSFHKKEIKDWLAKKLTGEVLPPNSSKANFATKNAKNISTNFFENFVTETPAEFLENIASMALDQRFSRTFSSMAVNNFSKNCFPPTEKRRFLRKRIRSLNEMFD